MDISQFPRKRNLQDLDSQITKSKFSPAFKKKRLGFSFPAGKLFQRVGLQEVPESVLNQNWETGEGGIVTKANPPMSSGQFTKTEAVISNVSADDAMDKEE